MTLFRSLVVDYMFFLMIQRPPRSADFPNATLFRSVPNYETELVERLVKGYISRYEFGFKRDCKRVVSWQYEVKDGDLVGGSDDRSGSVYARAEVASALYYNHTISSTKWLLLTASEQAAFEATLPFTRVDASLPDDGPGSWTADKTYTRGGVAIARRTFRLL